MQIHRKASYRVSDVWVFSDHRTGYAGPLLSYFQSDEKCRTTGGAEKIEIKGIGLEPSQVLGTSKLFSWHTNHDMDRKLGNCHYTSDL
jgi:hypothetical protein